MESRHPWPRRRRHPARRFANGRPRSSLMMLPAGKVSPLSRCPIKSDHDLHLLEKQRTALAEYVFALLEPGLKTDGPNLPASQRYVRHFLGDAATPSTSGSSSP